MSDAEPSPQLQANGGTTIFLLHAAILAARVLAKTGSDRNSLLASYHTVVSGGLFRAEDLLRGEAILVRARLVVINEGRYIPDEYLLQIRELPNDVACEVLLQRLIVVERPLWLYAAIENEDVLWENIPDEDQRLLEQLIADAHRREAFLLGLGKTVDAKDLTDLGAAGEDFVVEQCRRYLTTSGRPDLALTVQRVSLRSDQLGYDVTATDTSGRRHRLEVKTMRTAVDRAEFFLSRNEARTGKNDPHWALVFVTLDLSGAPTLLGWCRASEVTALLPIDVNLGARWSSARVSLPLERLRQGLPLDEA